MQIAAGLVTLGSILHAIVHKRNPLEYHPFFIFVGIYIVSQVLAASFSQNPGNSFAAFFQTDWFILLIPFFAALPLKPEERLTSVRILIASAALVAIYGLVQFFIGQEFVRGKALNPMGHFFRAEGGYNFYLTFAGNQLMIFGLGLSAYLFKKSWDYYKFFYFVAVSLIFFSIIASFGRSTWLAMLFITLIGSFLINRRFFGLITAALILIGFVVSFLSPEIYQRMISIFVPSENLGRLNLWKTSWAMFKDHTLFGIGQGNFNHLFPSYKVEGFYDAAGHSHNDYLNMAVISGIVGLVSWILMWISWFYFSIKAVQNRLFKRPDIIILFGSILAINSILIAAVFQCYYTDLENNILWWTIASLPILILNRNKTTG